MITKRSIFIAAALTAAGAGRLYAAVDFVKDIQPIFQESCLKCHGPEKQKGGLRLDSKAAAMKGGKDGEVIVPGQADKSDLYRRISLPAGSDDIMPNKGDPLTKAQTDLVRDWINQGGNWPDTASIQVTEAPTPPANAAIAALTEIRPPPAEAGAVAKLEAAGVAIRPIAMNVSWREANFHMLGTNITDATLAPLKDVITLVELNLAGTRVTDAGLQNLSGLTNLLTLHLEHTKISDAGLAALKPLAHLSYLNLFDTPVTDQGLVYLKDLRGLKRLYLWETKVTEQGVADLLKSLPDLQISRGWENEAGAKKDTEEKPAEKKDESQATKK
jgi:mono/diheme cytochrome c family protein